jgi:hypothetical protein
MCAVRSRCMPVASRWVPTWAIPLH